MSNGLIPTALCMILSIFLPDASVLYACTLASMAWALHRLFYPPLYRPNLVLLHGTLALATASAIKLLSGDVLIPDHTLPLTLEIMIFSFSILYLLLPHWYAKAFSCLHCKIPILNCWATQAIAVLTGIHLFLFSLICLLFHPLSHATLYTLSHIAPPVVYILCIAINHLFIKTVSHNYRKMPFLRIAPICNGKIYVLPRGTHSEEPGKLDLPIEEHIHACKADTDVCAKEIERKYSRHINSPAGVRFSLKYIARTPSGHSKTILLYILPLDSESQIHFSGGRFVSPKEIAADAHLYGSFLKAEAAHLNIAAQMWQRFK